MPSNSITFVRRLLWALAVTLATFATSVQAQTYNLHVLHRFFGSSDGYLPDFGVRFDSAGNLYGITASGGPYGYGVIFKIAIDGTYTVVHTFDGGADGGSPSGMTIDPVTSDIYGTASASGDDGNGVIYKLATDGTFTVLHTFDIQTDGGVPIGLARDAQGNLFGSAEVGGAENEGTVFEYSADGTFSVLYNFTKACHCGNPLTSVIPDNAGNLYGSSGGTIYKVKPDGTLIILHRPTGDEGAVSTLIAGHDGNLYGATFFDGEFGYGAVFKLARGGVYTTLHQFGGYPDGVSPTGLLSIGDDLYGVTFGGGAHGEGELFKIASNGNITTVYDFSDQEPSYSGIQPTGPLTMRNGRLYGTTVGRGDTWANAGTIYSVGVAAQ